MQDVKGPVERGFDAVQGIAARLEHIVCSSDAQLAALRTADIGSEWTDLRCGHVAMLVDVAVEDALWMCGGVDTEAMGGCQETSTEREGRRCVLHDCLRSFWDDSKRRLK